MFKAACIQMTSGPDIAENLAVATDTIRQAADQGAEFIATPENTCHIITPQSEKLKTAPEQEHHPAIPLFSDLAKDLNVWILAGSISVRIAGDKIANRSLLLDPNGDIVAFYDKIHLFDVDLPDKESYRESAIVRPGDRAVCAQTPWGVVGLTICYDLRFAALYRKLAQAGAFMLTVPAAFTVPTGRAHWDILLRARAIETGSFVLAPAQTGDHGQGRKTWGHSAIIGPWGDILAQADDQPGFIMADINPEDSAKARSAIPALQHDCNFRMA